MSPICLVNWIQNPQKHPIYPLKSRKCTWIFNDIKNLYWRENRCTCHSISILVDQILDGSIRNSSILHWFIIPYIPFVQWLNPHHIPIMVVSPSFLTITIKFLHFSRWFLACSLVMVFVCFCPWFSHDFSTPPQERPRELRQLPGRGAPAGALPPRGAAPAGRLREGGSTRRIQKLVQKFQKSVLLGRNIEKWENLDKLW